MSLARSYRLNGLHRALPPFIVNLFPMHPGSNICLFFINVHAIAGIFAASLTLISVRFMIVCCRLHAEYDLLQGMAILQRICTEAEVLETLSRVVNNQSPEKCLTGWSSEKCMAPLLSNVDADNEEFTRHTNFTLQLTKLLQPDIIVVFYEGPPCRVCCWYFNLNKRLSFFGSLIKTFFYVGLWGRGRQHESI